MLLSEGIWTKLKKDGLYLFKLPLSERGFMKLSKTSINFLLMDFTSPVTFTPNQTHIARAENTQTQLLSTEVCLSYSISKLELFFQSSELL